MTDGPPDVAAALQRLAELHHQGALSDEAYAQAREDLLRRTGGQPRQPWPGGPAPSQGPADQPGWGGPQGPVGGGPPEERTRSIGAPPGWGPPDEPTRFTGGYPPGGQASGPYPGPGYAPQAHPPHPGIPFGAAQGWAGPPQHPYPQHPQRSPRRRSRALIALAVVLVLVAGAVVLYTQVLRGEVILEPSSSPGEDPFTASTVLGPTAPVPAPRRFEPATPVGNGVPSAQGNEVGLYGDFKGNQNNCDREQMITFLTADPAKGTAWASVLGTSLAELPDFIRRLTPAVLRQDTRVTNHGYSDGRATPRQSVLQAGTKVLVDERGVPRAKCGCGNPLVEATPVSGLGYGYSGERWPDFRDDRLLAIIKSPVVVDVFTMTDLDSGDRFDRPAGSAGGSDASTGQVQVRLTWRGRADLDVMVTEPNGTVIWYNARSSGTGGQLDVDANGDCQGAVNDSQVNIENIFWPTGQAPVGGYRAAVTLYRDCGATSTDFQLRASVGGRVVAERAGSGATNVAVSFTYDG